jgi:hypothetical protein
MCPRICLACAMSSLSSLAVLTPDLQLPIADEHGVFAYGDLGWPHLWTIAERDGLGGRAPVWGGWLVHEGPVEDGDFPIGLAGHQHESRAGSASGTAATGSPTCATSSWAGHHIVRDGAQHLVGDIAAAHE